jgi:hypothetical protein
MKCWFRKPGTGEFRGEGKWEEISEGAYDKLSELYPAAMSVPQELEVSDG